MSFILGSSYKKALLVTFCFLLSACGGGGSSSNSSEKDSSTDSSQVDVESLIVKPNYAGKTELAVINDQQRFKVSLDIAATIDMLNVLTYSDVYDYYFLFPENRTTNVAASSCSSGKLEVSKISETHIKADYDNCVDGGITSNGTLDIIIRQRNSSRIFDMDVIPNISIDNHSNSEFLKISGFFKTRYNGNSNVERHVTTYQILLADDSGDSIYFDGLESKVNISDQFISFGGDIYFSQFGKVEINTQKIPESDSTVFSVQGRDEFEISIDKESGITVNSGLSKIPVVATFSDLADFDFDNTNAAPSAKITVKQESLERNEVVQLDSSSSSDLDFDVLTPTWKVIASPQNASWNLGAGAVSEFHSDFPGIYTIQLLVTDPYGASSSTEQVITVKQSEPNINTENQEYSVNADIKLPLIISNDDRDGPIALRLAYGPDGMYVNQRGEVVWDSSIPDFGITTTVNFGIAASNLDKVKVFDFNIAVKSNDINAVTPWILSIDSFLPQWNDSLKVIENEGKQQLVSSTFRSQIPLLIQLNENDDLEFNWATPVAPYSLTFLQSLDINDDGHMEKFWVRNDGKRVDFNFQDKWTLIIEDGKTHHLTDALSIDNYMSDGSEFGTIYLTDFNNSGIKELTVISNPSSHTTTVHSYSLNDFSLIHDIDIPEKPIGICDIDNDGYKDIVTTDQVYSIKNEETVFEFVDYDSNSQVIEANNRCYIFDGFRKILSYANGKLQSKFFGYEGTMIVGDFDNDTSDEVLYKEENVNSGTQWYLGELSSDGSVYGEPITLDELLTIEPLTALNLDGDIGDELLVSLNDRNTGKSDLRALKISRDVYNYRFESKYSLNDSANEPKSELEKSIRNTKGLFLDSDSIAGESSFYMKGNEYGTDNQFNKYKATGEEVWMLEDFQLKSLDATRLNNFLIGKYSDSKFSLIDKNTGELKSWKFKSMATSPRATNEEILIDYNENSVYKLEEDKLESIELPENVNELLANISSENDVDFVQYDDDKALELVLVDEKSSEKDIYKIFDTETWLEESLKPGDDGRKEYYSTHPTNKLNICSLSANECRNNVYLFNNRFEVLDKVSNKLIYRSPIFGGSIQDLRFEKREDNSTWMTLNRFLSSGYRIN